MDSVTAGRLAAMALQSWQRDLVPVGPSEGFGGLTQLPVLIAIAGLVWYLSQRVLAGVLIRKATAYCPQCFGGNIRQVPRRALNLLLPFVPPYVCNGCGRRFLRGRKPPFARCPKCRSAELQPARVASRWRTPFVAALRAHEYRCVPCEQVFLDFRPVRANASPAKELFDTGPQAQPSLESPVGHENP
jgi:DNA-directed RNA polymerase subunit RPC12/RpoP